MIPWWKVLWDLLSPPIPPPETPLLPSVVNSGTWLGCSGDKDALSCFLGELPHPVPSFTPEPGLSWGKGPGIIEAPHYMLRKPRLQRGRWLFQAGSLVRTGLLMTLSPGFSPPGLEGVFPQCHPSHGLCFSPLRNPSSPVKA